MDRGDPPPALCHALIKISAAEYDDILANCSEAALKYEDEEDEEIVRVGSSMELAQRLDDPIPSLPPRYRNPKTGYWHLYSTLPRQYHIFDIVHQDDVLMIWNILKNRTSFWELSSPTFLPPIDGSVNSGSVNRLREDPIIANQEYEAKGSPSENAKGPGHERSTIVTKPTLKNQSDEIWPPKTRQSLDPGKPTLACTDDRRSQYFRATNPPKMDCGTDLSPLSTKTSSINAEQTGTTPSFLSTNLTAEGKRQAQVAGDTLRANISPGHLMHSTSTAGIHSRQNRWALWGRSGQPFTQLPDSLTVKNNNELPPSDFSETARVPADESLNRLSTTKRNEPREVSSGSTQPKIDIFSEDVSHDQIPDQISMSKSSTVTHRKSQPTLIEVFDEELAKLSGINKSAKNHRATDAGSKSVSHLCEHPDLTEGATAHQTEDVFRPIIDRIERLASKLQVLDAEADQQISLLLQTLQQGIKIALDGFCTCIENVADHVQKTSNDVENVKNLKAQDRTQMDRPSSLLQSRKRPTSQDLAGIGSPGFSIVAATPAAPVKTSSKHAIQQVALLQKAGRRAKPFPSRSLERRMIAINPHLTFQAQVSERFKHSIAAPRTGNTQSQKLALPHSQITDSDYRQSKPLKFLRNPMNDMNYVSSKHSANIRGPLVPLGRQEIFRERLAPFALHTKAAVPTSSMPTDGTDRNGEERSHQPSTGPESDRNTIIHPQDPSYPNPQDRAAVSSTSGILADAQTTNHNDVATVAKIQSCVELLQKLGFGSGEGGDASRLVVYAQAAGGDLGEAIDLMEEEKRAYTEMGRRRFIC
ncbi:MAG: hypothetical protein Q9219_002825 [cf. Caloplaca sp. 3 TL-2023]